jgi:hypothetical protein
MRIFFCLLCDITAPTNRKYKPSDNAASGTFRTSRDVRLESAMGTKADVRHLWFTPCLRDENTSPLIQSLIQ